MKRPILDSRRRAVLAVVAAFPGGRECAATCLGLELKQFDNKLYENPGPSFSPRVGAVWHLSAQQSVYAQYQEGVAANNVRNLSGGEVDA